MQIFGDKPEVVAGGRAGGVVGRNESGHHRPQHGLSGAQGDEDRRRGGPPGRSGAGGGGGAGRGGGGRRSRTGDGQDPQRTAAGGAGGGGAWPCGWSRSASPAIGVHPRAASQFYRGRADHEITARVVTAVRHPRAWPRETSPAWRRPTASCADTGAAAVMVARGMLGDPWLVQRLLSRGRPAPADAWTWSSPNSGRSWRRRSRIWASTARSAGCGSWSPGTCGRPGCTGPRRRHCSASMPAAPSSTALWPNWRSLAATVERPRSSTRRLTVLFVVRYNPAPDFWDRRRRVRQCLHKDVVLTA